MKRIAKTFRLFIFLGNISTEKPPSGHAVKRHLHPAWRHALASYHALTCDVEHTYHGAFGGIPLDDGLGSRKQLDRASILLEIFGALS